MTIQCPNCNFVRNANRPDCPICQATELDAKATAEPGVEMEDAGAVQPAYPPVNESLERLRDAMIAETTASQAVEAPAAPIAVPPAPPPAVEPPATASSDNRDEAEPEALDTAEEPIQSSLIGAKPANGVETGQPGRAEVDISDEDLLKLEQSGLFVVAMLGFPTAGKTWFLNRLKHICHERGDVSPDLPALGQKQEASRTFAVTAHSFNKAGGGFVIIDIPGERFLRAVDTNFADAEKLLLAIKVSKALLFVLPADEALIAPRAAKTTGPVEQSDPNYSTAGLEAQQDSTAARALALQQELAAANAAVRKAEATSKAKLDSKAAAAALRAAKETKKRINDEIKALKNTARDKANRELASTNQRMETFIRGMGRMAGLISMRDAAPADEKYGQISSVELSNYISNKFKPCERPAFIALTKADHLTEKNPLVAAVMRGSTEDRQILENFDVDPLHTIRQFRPSLARPFDEWFRWSKFDFVTAFADHKGGTLIDYDCGHHGVEAVIEWINWANSSRSWPAKTWWDLGAARMIRRFRDGKTAQRRDIGLSKEDARG